MAPRISRYGSWKSPVTSSLIVSSAINFHHMACDGADIYWIEWRPTEGGRHCIVRLSGGIIEDITPPGFNARTLVHEYGGGAFAVDDGIVYFSNFSDQAIYSSTAGAAPKLLWAEPGMRFADAVVDRQRKRLMCVREDHTVAGQEAENTIVSLPLNELGKANVLVSGKDFYSNPRLSPDGLHLAWLSWNHPNMPWDGCELYVGRLNAEGTVASARLVAGGQGESILQPEWSPDGHLYFISDKSLWWNLYRLTGEETEPLCPMPAEFGRPQWVFGFSSYAIASPHQIICSFTQKGTWHLAALNPEKKTFTPLDIPYTDINWVRSAPGAVVFRGGSPSEPASIVKLDLQSRQCTVLRSSNKVAIDCGYISIAEPIEFPTGNGLTAHGFFYPPANKDYKAPAGSSPPLLVKTHGGPTGAATSTFNLEIQYWTSRGIAVLDVNYGGSSGYGRAYRQRLDGNWGIVDVDDCAAGALYLVKRGSVDGRDLIISGGSAGGYTTLCALTFGSTFKCGGSYYGIGDLEALVKDTHKFESRYLDRLIGPYPQQKDLYIARSPVHHTDKLSCPIIFLQGLDDKVVPPNQAVMMVDALRKKKIPVAYLAFAGEQHGFRQAYTVARALDAEFYFYSRALGFEPADVLEPVAIENLQIEAR